MVHGSRSSPFRLDGWNFNMRIKRASELRAKYLDYHGWEGVVARKVLMTSDQKQVRE